MQQISGSTALEFNPALSYVAFSDQQKGKLLIVYRSPVILIPGEEPRPLSIEWDGDSSAIAVKVPDDAKVPFVVHFSIDKKVPQPIAKLKKIPELVQVCFRNLFYSVVICSL